MSSSNARQLRWPRLGSLALLLLSTVVSLGVAELVLSAIPGVQEPERPVVTRYDSLLGWSLVPDTSATIREAEFTASERINALGLRGPEVPASKPPGEIRVLLLGDSFTEGYTVDQGQTLDRVLEGALGELPARVINAGTRGWSTDQELLYFKSNAAELAPDVTVLLFFINDVCMNARDRYWRGSKPRYALKGDSLVLGNVPVPPPAEGRPGGGVGDALRRTALYQTLARAADRLERRLAPPPVPRERAPWLLSDDAHPCLAEGWELTARLLVELRREAETVGSRLIVFWVPTREAVYPESWEHTRRAYATDPDSLSPTADAERLGEICSSKGLDCLIPLEAFRDAARSSDQPLYYVQDPHWAPAGHALAGRLLAKAVRERLAGSGDAAAGVP